MDNNKPSENVVPETVVVKKSSKALIILSIFCVILAIAGVGFGVWAMMNKGGEKPSEPATSSTDQPTVAEEDKTDEVKALVAEYRKIAVDMVGDGKFKDTASDVVGVKFGDNKARTMLEKSYGFEVSNTSDEDFHTVFNEITALIEEHREKLEASGFVKDYSTLGFKTYYNEDTGIVCRSGDGMPYDFSCGYYKWVNSEDMSLVNELAEAYKTKTSEYPALINVANKKIKNSPVSPYQTLEASFLGAAAVYYRVSPDAEWKFFAPMQAPYDCSDYDTQELKNAFAGWDCYTGDAGVEFGQTLDTVQP